MTAIGPLIAATIVTGDLDRASTAYRTGLGLRLVAEGRIGDQVAALWQTPTLADARWSLLATDRNGCGGLRLVEVPGATPVFEPLTSLGWAAAELSVIEPERLLEPLRRAGFQLLGKPRALGSNPAIRAMQIAGRDGEVLYLTDVRAYDGPMSVYRATRPVDRMFIAVLACRNVETARGFYEHRFAADRVSDRAVDVPVLRQAMDLPDDAVIRISSVQISGDCLIEFDQYPAVSHERPMKAGMPCGVAMITARAEAVDGSPIDMPPYDGAPAQMIRGREGEWIELIGSAP